MNKKGYKLSYVILIIIFTSIISAVTSGIIIINSFGSSNGKSYSELLQDENLQSFLEVYSKITNDYYEDIDKEKVIKNAIDAMMKSLDESYTTYLDEDTTENLKKELNGKYDGIGITIQNNNVIGVLANSPAERNGIQLGDKIISVNGTNVEETSGGDITFLIKNSKDNVELTIQRGDQTLNFSMKPEELDYPSVSTKMIDGTTIGLLTISVFSINLEQEVDNALTDLRTQGMNKLIIDLRNNTGGFLDQSNKVASLFLEKGKVIYYLETKDKIVPYKDESTNKLEIPIVVLVNGSTASAAEILASALHDSYGAPLVGKTTYGKGKVQHTLNMESGSMVKYTSSKWLTPSKKCIDELGIIPDYNIDNEYLYDESPDGTPIIKEVIDKQLQRAVELLNS